MTTQPTNPLETVARVPPGFWSFVQTLPLDERDRLLRYGSVRYQMRKPGKAVIMHADAGDLEFALGVVR